MVNKKVTKKKVTTKKKETKKIVKKAVLKHLQKDVGKMGFVILALVSVMLSQGFSIWTNSLVKTATIYKATSITMYQSGWSSTGQIFRVTVFPTTTTNKNIICYSSNKAVATVQTVNGTAPACNVTRVGLGTATITAKTTDGSNLSIAKTVSYTLKATGISMAYYNNGTNGLKRYKVIVTPATALNHNVSCTSSNTAIATVKAVNGLVDANDKITRYSLCEVTPIKNGTVTITTKTTDGTYLSKSLTVVINTKATGVSLIYGGRGRNYSIIYDAAISPTTAIIKNVNCTSSNTAIATTIGSGTSRCEIVPLKAGSIIFTAKTTDGTNLLATRTLSFSTKATSISLTDEMNLDNGAKSYRALVGPTNLLNKSVVCTSSNTAIATVKTVNWEGGGTEKGDLYGTYSRCIVTPIKNGTVTITAKTTEGSNLYASKTVTFAIKATSIVIGNYGWDSTGAQVYRIAVNPITTINKSITCTSSNTAVAKVVVSSSATIGGTCTVTPIGAGTVTITAKTADGTNLAAYKTLTYTAKATGITMTDYSTTATGGKVYKVVVTPTTAINQKITCISSNPAIASVTTANFLTDVTQTAKFGTCTVTPIKNGTVTITAKTLDGSLKSVSKTYTVTGK